MRPLRLTACAFGPYRTEQRMDFRALGDRKLFLINGPTGAGKSSVLDAMAYALFGEASGTDRDAGGVRSHHAAVDEPTEVRFEFAAGPDLYRIVRRPRQPRPKKRGTGTIFADAEAALYRLSAEEPVGPESVGADTDLDAVSTELLAERGGEVRARVATLLGFDAEQFRQIVVLPQGEFRRFLLADSKGREEMLEVLFGTAVYRAIEQALKAAASDLRKEGERLGERRRGRFEQLGVEGEGALEEAIVELAAEIETAAAARRAAAIVELAAEIETAAAARRAADSDRERVAAAVVEAERAQSRLAALADARRDAEAAKRQLNTLDADGERLKRARRAAAAAAVLEGEARARAEREEANEAARRLAGELAAAESKAAEAEREAERHRAAGAGLVEDRQRLQRMIDARGPVGDLLTATAAVEGRERELGLAELRAAETASELAALEADLKASREAVTAAAAKAADLEQHKARALLLGTAKEARQKADSYRSVLLSRSVAVGGGKQAEEVALEALHAAKRDVEVAEHSWRAGDAASLAAELRPGQPCPVCGSTDHPAPAVPVSGAATREDVDRARTLMSDCERGVEAARAAHEEARIAEAETRSKLDALTPSLGEWVDRDPVELDAAFEAANTAVAEAGRATVLAEEGGQRIVALQERVEAATTTATSAREARDQLKVALSAALAEQATLAKQVPEPSWREPGVLDEAIETLERSTGEAEAAAKVAETAAQASRTEVGAARARADEADKRCTAAEAKLAEASTKLDAELARLDFALAADARAAQLSDAETDALEGRIETARKEITAVEERLRVAEAAAKDLLAPDMEALAEAQRKANEEATAAADREASVRQRHGALLAARDDLKSAAGDQERLDRRYSVVGRLADVAAGKTGKNVSFQRFVLSALLDDVLVAASLRLGTMSAGRYALSRVETAQDGRRAAGLDLEVFDSFTGRARGVATLSGGESFLASLALALGLSDVAQAYAGGTRMESVFIDEGFGSLDPEALDLALRALEDLEAGGRLVGVISHVPELKERIGARLEIAASVKGSTARFVVD